VKTPSPFDAIIIGSGIAGLHSALRLAETGRAVLVVTKKKIAHTATNFAQGGIAAVLSQTDDVEKHSEDTLEAGAFHNNKRAVSYMVKHGAASIRRLIEYGVPFATHGGELLLTREGGHSERRIVFVSDYTGKAVEEVLVKRAKKHPLITIWEDATAGDFIVRDGHCLGVEVIQEGEVTKIYASAVILASGGVGQIYAYTTNPLISTGDGIAMAHRAGCTTRDLEFIQFHPTAFHHGGKTRFLISEAVRGEGAHLLNSKHKRFMVGRHPRAELAPRDIVSREIYKEERDGPVYLDLRHKDPVKVHTRFPQISAALKKYGFDMARDLIPISPAAHYLCGGVEVDLKGRTSLPGLFAFGEVAWTGVHGANRLASNSLLEALVFSERIVDEIRGTVRGDKSMNSQINGPPPSARGTNLPPCTPSQKRLYAKLRRSLQKTMWESAGIIRTEEGLKKGLSEVKAAEKLIQNPDSLEGRELSNMLTASELIILAALRRKTSLGCHFRSDSED